MLYIVRLKIINFDETLADTKFHCPSPLDCPPELVEGGIGGEVNTIAAFIKLIG